jgi:hypothetical protein
MERKDFTPDQLTALDALIRVYPSGLGIEDAGVRAVFDSLILRDSGLVKCIDWDESPSGDAYVLTDEYAEALRAETTEAADSAAMN